MWGFYKHIIGMYLNGHDFIEPAQASSVFIYYMVRAPNEFKNANDGTDTPLSLLFKYIHKVFEVGKLMESEIVSMTGVALIIAILEHLGQNDQAIIGNIDSINNMYIKEMSYA